MDIAVGSIEANNIGGGGSLSQLGECLAGECLTRIQPGSVLGVEVVPPRLLVLGTHAPAFAPSGGLVGPNSDDDFVAKGGVVEVVLAQNRGDYDPYDSLRYPTSEAVDGNGDRADAVGRMERVAQTAKLAAMGGVGLAVIAALFVATTSPAPSSDGLLSRWEFVDGRPDGTARDRAGSVGFTLTPLDDQRLLALTDAATVEATVHPDPTVGDETGARRFPTAPDESVVLELRLR